MLVSKPTNKKFRPFSFLSHATDASFPFIFVVVLPQFYLTVHTFTYVCLNRISTPYCETFIVVYELGHLVNNKAKLGMQ